ncbi:hypothetical protein RE6C_05927 [Rhodopirellula europaea 6C]|uniref:Uncharacterized protein n=1 Tax=Rhodopirellula europaea 6C TaxID=1263867 RepID=M2ATN4_9BACT|nr:hypothetical protein RE6C_05927 [Rhodopirellula europaea 6C]
MPPALEVLPVESALPIAPLASEVHRVALSRACRFPIQTLTNPGWQTRRIRDLDH